MNSTHKSNDEESNAIKFSQREKCMVEVSYGEFAGKPLLSCA